ncbi:CRTAC1 family protein [Celeribacter arenosi]|uniref:CRTAC1 family protein n=1 Tax=Celeribacter arenosi TaxID=792649 RepID=A0ABP7KDJ2_9RHOB
MRRAVIGAGVGLCALPVCAGDIRFEEVVVPAHRYTGGWEHFVGGGVAVFDCNGDELPDLFAAGGSRPASLMVNRSARGGAIAFEAVAIDEIVEVTGAYPLDIDGDGVLDLAVMRVGENRLLRGLGGCAFEDATQAWGFEGGDRWSTSFTATWEDGADRATFFVGNYVNREDPEGPFEACDANELHRPVAGGWEKTVLEPGFCALSALMSKGARDRVMLRISNDRHYYVKGGYEQLYDLRENRFLGDSDGWEKVSLWGMGIAERDVNGDQLPDVMLTSMGDQLLQFATPAGGYVAAPYETGTYAHRPHVGDDGRATTGWHAEWGDVDNDGLVDLFIAKGNVEQMPSNAARDPNNLLRQRGDGTFEEVSVAAGVASLEKSRGAGVVDFNADGKLDLVVVNRRGPLQVWRNVSVGSGRWIEVAVPYGRGGVGTRVEVESGGVVQMQEVTVGGGHVSGKAVPLHFGVGESEVVRVRMTTPDGTQGPWVERATSR